MRIKCQNQKCCQILITKCYWGMEVAMTDKDSGDKITVIFWWQGKVTRSRPEARSPDYGWRDKVGAKHGH